jgi:4-amino-4-deoxychorismate lyase
LTAPISTARIFDGAVPIPAWSADARGIAYGDGVFETMRVHRGTVAWWDAHWQRLSRGAECLQLALPTFEQAQAEAAALFEDGGDGVLKLLLTRGGGGRGYSVSKVADPLWMLSRSPLPPECSKQGLALHICVTRLAVQPALAGIKHCNRLEQILARAECDEARADEGLMLDMDGNVISATAANLFVLLGRQWVTPQVDRCGIAGVCRQHLLPLLEAREQQLSMEDLEAAEAVFLCNAVRGILPVARIGGCEWAPHPLVARAMHSLARIHPGMETA